VVKAEKISSTQPRKAALLPGVLISQSIKIKNKKEKNHENQCKKSIINPNGAGDGVRPVRRHAADGEGGYERNGK
jgi:hypothetical protein